VLIFSNEEYGLFMIKKILLLILLFTSTQVYSARVEVEQVNFVSNEVTLSGSLVFPEDDEIHSAVVFVHGSGKQLRNIHWAESFAAAGIAAFVYDKRGAGKSGGVYESKQSVGEENLNLLADDVVSALSVLVNHSRLKGVPLGLTGISQAGWIVPLAAEKADKVDFIALWSGPVCKVSEEDIFSKYTADLDDKKVPSYDEALASRRFKYIWPDFLGKDTDSSESLAKLNIPGLWVFGENDGSVPVDLSIKRLKKLKSMGHQYEYVLFSSLGHNNMAETFSIVTDWVKRLNKSS